jgi:hypothetical protein
VGDIASTPASRFRDELGFGLGTVDQRLPFQRTASVCQRKQSRVAQYAPTAQAFPADRALTPVRWLLNRLGAGLDTGDQRAPFQWMISVRATHAPKWAHRFPTAQTFLDERALTPSRRLTGTVSRKSRVRIDCLDHLAPFQWRRVPNPTAHALRDETPLTACSSPPGAGTVDHRAPFQWRISEWNAGCPGLPKSPTAQASLADTALTPSSWFIEAVEFGLGTLVHVEPSQRRTSVWTVCERGVE